MHFYTTIELILNRISTSIVDAHVYCSLCDWHIKSKYATLKWSKTTLFVYVFFLHHIFFGLEHFSWLKGNFIGKMFTIVLSVEIFWIDNVDSMSKSICLNDVQSDGCTKKKITYTFQYTLITQFLTVFEHVNIWYHNEFPTLMNHNYGRPTLAPTNFRPNQFSL